MTGPAGEVRLMCRPEQAAKLIARARAAFPTIGEPCRPCPNRPGRRARDAGGGDQGAKAGGRGWSASTSTSTMTRTTGPRERCNAALAAISLPTATGAWTWPRPGRRRPGEGAGVAGEREGPHWRALDARTAPCPPHSGGSYTMHPALKTAQRPVICAADGPWSARSPAEASRRPPQLDGRGPQPASGRPHALQGPSRRHPIPGESPPGESRQVTSRPAPAATLPRRGHRAGPRARAPGRARPPRRSPPATARSIDAAHQLLTGANLKHPQSRAGEQCTTVPAADRRGLPTHPCTDPSRRTPTRPSRRTRTAPPPRRRARRRPRGAPPPDSSPASTATTDLHHGCDPLLYRPSPWEEVRPHVDRGTPGRRRHIPIRHWGLCSPGCSLRPPTRPPSRHCGWPSPPLPSRSPAPPSHGGALAAPPEPFTSNETGATANSRPASRSSTTVPSVAQMRVFGSPTTGPGTTTGSALPSPRRPVVLQSTVSSSATSGPWPGQSARWRSGSAASCAAAESKMARARFSTSGSPARTSRAPG